MYNEPLTEPIYHIMRSYKMAMRKTLKAKELGLNKMYIKCLSFIYTSENCTANDIANHFHRDKGQIARLVKDMIEREWITKVPNPEDKRSQILILTQQGNDIAQLVSDTQTTLQKKMQESLTKEETEAFRAIANKISASLKV
ncbi:MarR family winged helix-turn-helix transcriptional regulator [Vibrio sp. S4M6]|uniref:MarR family winged helix-turn-helix transcriptional regulator n=1 Tax=Vibrio sinus TaxID=2946865 RepID=UPI00202A1506|nr:MarR family transcriptional regulator [Vibrio sinus]MCL9780029.1 MarR family winged helix-turn-helix transcriptional regulator [Vibrio sinus]